MLADVVLRGAAVVTLDPARPRARAVDIREGRIVGAGDDREFDELCGTGTRVIDLPGRAVVPGFVDAHIHFGSFAMARQQLDLDSAATVEQGLARVREFGQRLIPGQWLRGRGWDRNRWGRLPTATELDSATGARPAALASHDGHSVWLNSAAMAALDIGPGVETPAGGVIERDANRLPTGVFFENAEKLVRRRLPEPTSQELRTAIRSALGLAAAAGLTGLHNLEDEHSLAAFRVLEAAGDLTL